jgi:hypothetical protein
MNQPSRGLLLSVIAVVNRQRQRSSERNYRKLAGFRHYERSNRQLVHDYRFDHERFHQRWRRNGWVL